MCNLPNLTNIWYMTIDGNEDTITCLTTPEERVSLEATLQSLKQDDKLSDFVVVTVIPSRFPEAIQELIESLDRFEITLPALKVT